MVSRPRKRAFRPSSLGTEENDNFESMEDTQQEIEQGKHRMAWWRASRFGMFIHWGLYSVLGRGEWAMNRENILAADYEKLASEFNPRYFKPKEWIRLAKESGMKYIVFTTKHHDGFCLWDSNLTDYTSVKAVARRDFVRELVDACHADGMPVGLYFSLIDWHHPDGDGRGITDPDARERYISFVHGQVRELCSNYGKISILWYDVPWPYDAEHWRSVELNAMARELQPGIIINNRAKTQEDFGTPEGHIKAEEAGRDWEACMTLNDNWGYHLGDKNWKSSREVIMMLADCAQKGGNLLLNVGPNGDGIIPAESQRILKEVGAWLERNGVAIYDTDRADVGWNNWGKFTVRGRSLYLIIDKWTGSEMLIGRLSCEALSARLVVSGDAVDFELRPHGVRLTGLPQIPPDYPVTVIEIEMDRIPKHSSGPSYIHPTHSWYDPEVGIV